MNNDYKTALLNTIGMIRPTFSGSPNTGNNVSRKVYDFQFGITSINYQGDMLLSDMKIDLQILDGTTIKDTINLVSNSGDKNLDKNVTL